MQFKDGLFKTAAYYFVACAASIVGTFAALAGWMWVSKDENIDKIKSKLGFHKKEENKESE